MSTRKILTSFLPVSIAAATLSGCFIDDMQTNMSTMTSTTSSMSKDMSSMKQDTHDGMDHTNDLMTGLYQDGRQAGAVALRRDTLKAMENATSQEDKIGQAAIYAKAFEFELLKEREMGDKALRESLYQDAMAEFFRTLDNYLPAPGTRNVDPTSTNAKMMDLYALSVTLQEINDNAQTVNQQLGVPDVTLYSLIRDGLLMRRAYMSPGTESQEPGWVHELASHYDDAVYLLQVRANFLPAMTVAATSDIQKKSGFLNLGGLITKLKMAGVPGLEDRIKFLRGHWVAKTDSMTPELIEEATRYLTGANDALDLLKQLGESAPINGAILEIYKNMQILDQPQPAVTHGEENSPTTAAARALTSLRNADVAKLRAQVARFLKQ